MIPSKHTTVLVLFLLLALLPGCPAPSIDATETLEAEGYENIELGGPALLTCSDSEHYSRTFVATRNGQRVEGAVCCTGILFGGCTVRH